MVKPWLSFALTPVQGFIEGARTVRDLKVGSAILCHLTRQAIDAGTSAGGRLVYPVLDGGAGGSIPNQFLMAFDDAAAAEAAATACARAVRTAWDALAGGIHGLLNRPFANAAGADRWDHLWTHQVQNYWDVHCVVWTPSPGDEALAQCLFGAPEPDPWKRQWKLVAAALAMRKQVRRSPGHHGVGRAKCAMMGDYEQMGPDGKVGEQDRFWKRATPLVRRGIFLRESDRLCAIALVKRFAPAADGAPAALRELTEAVPDTAKIAAAGWWARVTAAGHGAALAAWDAAVEAANTALEEFGDTPARFLLDETLNFEAQFKDAADAERREEVKARSREPFAAMVQERKALFDAAKRAGLGKPPRYIAVLALDGDKMGERLGGDLPETGALDEQFYAGLSGPLRTFGQATAATLVENAGKGYLVYAGGDDLLALLPMREALQAALALRKAYPQLPPAAVPTTASIGLAICHFTHDLRAGLRAARAALESAKEAGRDRLGWRLLPRSGGASGGVMEYPLAEQVAGLSALFAEGGSDRWSRRIEGLLKPIIDFAEPALFDEDQARLMVRYTVRHIEDRDEMKDRMIAAAEGLLEAVFHHLDARNAAFNGAHRGLDIARQKRIRTNTGFAAEALRMYIDLIRLAGFVVRTRE